MSSIQNNELLLQKVIENLFSTQKKFVLLETLKVDSDNYKTYIFYSPKKEIILTKQKNIKNFFEEIESWIKKGYYIAGFFSYELGYFLDYPNHFLMKDSDFDFPLAFFYVFKSPLIFNHKFNQFENFDEKVIRLNSNKKTNTYFKISQLNINTSKVEYIDTIKKIKEYIFSGDTYQVNFTIKTKFNFTGSLLGLYNHLKQTQKVSYSGVFCTEDFSIISFSPELFFRKTKDKIIVKPMKGTIARGRNLVEDKIQSRKLYLSIKNRAENVMIVDLLRNDLGKIAPYGEVKVEKLFEIEKYETLFQMTSTISAKVNPKINLYKLFKCIFPSGSVTGAPKIRTMQIIKETEKEPRKVYTGALGFFTPEKNGVFNVAIRTILIYKNGNGEMGIGSGIVGDSNPEKEFEECKLKSLFFLKKQQKFRIIETILYSPNFNLEIKNFFGLKLNITKHNFQNGFFLLDFHMDRLKKSMLYFDFPYDKNKILKKLFEVKSKIDNIQKDKNNLQNQFYRIRLLISKDGNIQVDFCKLNMFEFCSKKSVKIAISKKRTQPNNTFLYHKTTNRRIYNSEYNKYKSLGFFDVMFLNINNEVTECSRTNIVIKKNNKFYTPQINSGVLPGVFRRFLLAHNPDIIQTRIKIEDVVLADKIFITNSVIGIRPAIISCINPS